MSLELTSASDGEVLFVSPTVSRSRWADFALKKLRAGYALRQHALGRVFHFVKAGETPSPCPAHAARTLLGLGVLEVLQADPRGTLYGLSPHLQDPAGAVA